MILRISRIGGVLATLLLMSACATNPVTGERELSIVGQQQEISIGEEQYAYSRQMQGGDYTVDPGLTRYVQRIGQDLAKYSARDLPYEFEVINSGVPNAWALPGGKIALNRGLLHAMDSEAELAAVIGHEIVHADAGHGAQQMQRGMLLQAGVVAAGIAASDTDYAPYVVGGASVGAQLLTSKYSRDAESEADRYGMEYMSKAGYNPEGAVDLQQTFVELAESNRQDWLSGLFASHPPSRERVEKNKQTADRLGRDGQYGREAYQRAMRTLRNDQPAYEAYEKGRKALSEGDREAAMRYAREAIDHTPQEGLFYGLLGDAYAEGGDERRAVDAFNEALERQPGWFYYHLRRGTIKRDMGDLEDAEVDLKQSVELLPTKIAYQNLGQIEQRRGNTAAAQRYFEMAEQGSGQQ